MAKAKDAFRTISEVADWLDTPAHVLRFWESKFTQIKPVKRAGGRRYYRPDDMMLLAGIKTLLHEQGLTIKGAQKLLREKGVKHVQNLSPLQIGGAGEEGPEPSAPAGEAASPISAVSAPAEDADGTTAPDTAPQEFPELATSPQPVAEQAPSAPIAASNDDASDPDDPVPEQPDDLFTPSLAEDDASPPAAQDDGAASGDDLLAAVRAQVTRQPASIGTAMPPPTPLAPTAADRPGDGAADASPAGADIVPLRSAMPPPPRRPDAFRAPPPVNGPRVLELIAAKDSAALRARAGQIAPLVQRLEALRDRMRQV